MGIINWFKRTTFQGKIKNDIGEFSSSSRGAIHVQELEPAQNGKRKYRFNNSVQNRSLPVVLEQNQVEELTKALQESLKKS